MTRFVCAMLLLMVVCVDGLYNLSQMPPPMPGYQPLRILRQWFTVYRRPSNIWPLTRDDSNLDIFLWHEGNNVIGFQKTFGQKTCSQVVGNMAFLFPPAIKLKLNDGFGGWMASKSIVVGTDYERFLIHWSCKRATLIGNMCPDPAITVLSRTPHPDKSTIAAMNSVLMNLWGITVHQLRKVLHNGMCFGGPRKFLH